MIHPKLAMHNRWTKCHLRILHCKMISIEARSWIMRGPEAQKIIIRSQEIRWQGMIIRLNNYITNKIFTKIRPTPWISCPSIIGCRETIYIHFANLKSTTLHREYIIWSTNNQINRFLLIGRGTFLCLINSFIMEGQIIISNLSHTLWSITHR